jgi:AAHS family 4-hydroxybenzoate transporter-like MFS transporter
MTATLRTSDVQKLIDASAFSGVQRWLLTLCFLVVAIDGFDTAIIGFIAPALRVEWHLEIAQLGPLFAAGLFGLMIGSFVVGPFADRYGRKTMLVVAALCFGGASLASAFSTGIRSLTWLRFATGMGLGGAMPTAITLTSEYCPTHRRSSLVTLMFCGFTIGSALGGIAAAQVVTAYGWRPLFLGGGLVPMLLAPMLARILPESVRYLTSRDNRRGQLRATLQRLVPDADLDDAIFTGSHARTSSPVRILFGSGVLQGTLLLWLAFFMSLLVVYLLSSWMPTLIQRSGTSLKGASLITAMFQVGGTIGAIVLGRLMDKFNPHHVLGIAYIVAGACVTLMGAAATTSWLMTGAVFGAGFCVSGGQVGANALAAAFYPTACRTTGVSWAIGVGRSGSILGSLMGGAMLARGWSLAAVYGLVAIPTLISGTAILVLGLSRRRATESRGPC